MKSCYRCGIEKRLADFYKDIQKSDGHSRSCISCLYVPVDRIESNKLKRIDVEGELLNRVYGYWSVLSVSDRTKDKGHVYYNCTCACGNERVVRKSTLKTGKTTSCGCAGSTLIKGLVFGRLTVLTNGFRNKEGRICLDAVCEYGKRVFKAIPREWFFD